MNPINSMSPIKKIIYSGVFLGLITAFFAIALSVTDQITAPRIAEVQRQNFENALLLAIPEATGFEVIEDFNLAYTLQIIRAYDESGVLGYVYHQQVQGFADAIRYMIGVNTEGYFTRFIVLFSRETPGFGSRMFQAEWLDRVENRHAAAQIDALTNATITTAPIARGLAVIYEDFDRRLGSAAYD